MEGEVSPARWAKEVEKWEAERDSARSGQRKPGWNKPKMPSMERALPKPKVSNFVEDSKEEEEGHIMILTGFHNSWVNRRLES